MSREVYGLREADRREEHIGDYASLTAAVTAIGSTVVTLVVDDATTITANTTIPSTLSLVVTNMGSIAKTSTYTLTINGPFEAGLYQVFSGFSAGDVTFGAGAVKEVYPEWWGSGAVAFQSAINSGCKDILFSSDDIDSTLTFTTLIGINFKGRGCGSDTLSSSTLTWTGAANGTLIKSTGTRDSAFKNFNITVGTAPSTLMTAFDFDPTGRSQAETNIAMRDVHIVQRGGVTTPDNSLSYGVRISRSTSPGNVDTFSFYNIFISGCAVAGVSIEHSQSRVVNFFNPAITFCAMGITNTLNSSSGGDFMVFGGQFGNNTTADIYLNGTANTNIFGALSENSARFIDVYGSNAAASMFISGVYMAGWLTAGDGQVMRFGTAALGGTGGPITIQGCSFATDAPAKIGHNSAYGQINSIGNFFNNSTPFVNNGGIVKISSIGDRGWDGATYLPLSIPITTISNGDTSPIVFYGDLYTLSTGGTTTITTFDNGFIGQTITLMFGDTGWTIAETDNIKLSSAFTSSADDVMTLIYDGTNWREISRSVN